MSAEPKIVIFTTPTCSWCTRAKQFLRENRLRFTEVDVAKSESAARDLLRVSGQTGVPVLLINNRPVVGFDRPKINRMLGLK